jgi:hypothetical protein
VAQYIFTGAYSAYYPLTGLTAEPGQTYELDAAPDGHWKPAGEPSQTPAPKAPADAVEAAEALLEANPALAQEVLDKVAKNA